MVFSSELFLFVFLPAVLGLYLLAPGPRLKNAMLVGASLVFYGWGEPRFVAVVVGSAMLNYAFGLMLSRLPGDFTRERRLVVAIAVTFNVAVLVWFKYSSFFADNLNFVLGNTIGRQVSVSQVYLPLGISFFTFHAISYIVDVYRRTSEARRNPLEVLLYFVFFSQLIAGPIIRYKDVAAQLSARRVQLEAFSYGVRRFVVGLAKKVLVADTLGRTVDQVFAADPGHIAHGLAWFAIAAYALQIYFDFSGYSDMAIGLARMFGFRFLENFDFPYVAGSIQEFWRRWHISLSRWFRDYLYIPLGGNRVRPWRMYANLVTVFFLCGLWHGAKWTFVVWGLIHGTFLVIERIPVMRTLTRTPVIKHVYVLLVVVLAWVFFRADSLPYALGYLQVLAVGSIAPNLSLLNVGTQTFVTFVAACFFATPFIARRVDAAWDSVPALPALITRAAVPAALALLFVSSVAKLAAGTYSPFIYFRF